MASLTREFGVPTILGLKTATQGIKTGDVITVDAYSGRVYAGLVDELLAFKIPRTAHMAGTPVHEVLVRVASHIVPLNLIDPKAADFRVAGCRTLHDIMRLLHERCYGEMFKLSDVASGQDGVALRLKAKTGLDLYVIDLGGGVEEREGRGADLLPEDVRSRPFKALLDGLTLDQEQLSTPRPVQVKGLLSVMSQQMISNPSASGERFGDRSYAIISDKYINFSSRVGYHYGVLDCYCGRTVSKNYITFSFKGGAADDLKRARRARAIGLILESNGFRVEVQGDRVVGRLQKHETEVILEKLWIMGKLLQFTRQTDMLMVNEKSVEAMASCFLSGKYVLDPSCPMPEAAAKLGNDGEKKG
jgi:pyruvate,water dikinase